MTQAYCVSAHKNPQQVRMLVDHLCEEDLVYMNVFNHRGAGERAAWGKWFSDIPPDRLFIRYRYKRGWGTFSQVQAALDAMNYFKDAKYTHFVNLSGQCYPIKPMDEVRDFFRRSPETSFMEAQAVVYEEGEEGYNPDILGRLGYWWIRYPDIYFRLTGRSNFGFRNKFLKVRRRWNKEVPGGLRPYKGSSWFMLSKDAVDHVLEAIAGDPRIIGFFRRSGLPDESFFHTILMNSALPVVSEPQGLHYIDWSRDDVPNPPVLDGRYFDALRSSPKLFARKFDIVAEPGIFQRVERELVARTSGEQLPPAPGEA